MHHLLDLFQHFSYLGIFVSLVFVGYIVPLPEEVVLMSVGYFIGTGHVHPLLALLVAIIAVVAGDTILFYLSRSGSKLVALLIKRLRRHHIMKHESAMRDHMGKTIIFTRFIVGIRLLGPFLAGSSGTSYRKFLGFDFLTVIVYAPILIGLGFYFHKHFFKLVANVMIIRHVVLAIAVVVLGGLIAWYMERQVLFNKNKTDVES